MITNAREYQITRAQVARLGDALISVKDKAPKKGVHLKIHESEIAAIESEIARLNVEILAYEDLLEGRQLSFDSSSLEDLPDVLIKARIANRWSQKQVAERLGVHEQQVQRYEASRYRSVSLERLIEIAHLLGVRVQQKILLMAPIFKNARSNLKKLGFSDDFIQTRVGPSPMAKAENEDPSVAMETLERVRHIFGWRIEQLAGQQPLRVAAAALGGALFKLPGGRNSAFVEAYTAYAYRLACGAASCAMHIQSKPIPSDWKAARAGILAGGQMTLARVVDWLWDLGVVVIPLSDRAAFNGAFWRIGGRNVVVIKQKTASPDRLMHDALHEGYHASQQPDMPNRVVVDVDLLDTSNPEEVDANTFASDVLLNGEANSLVKEVAKVAGGFGPNLKTAVQQVATRHAVSIGALANHLAWVLERQDRPLNWWGTAHNLQKDATTELAYARDIAFQRLQAPSEPNTDVDLLFRALRAEETI
jgi:transcriptional regulator with XRE-family HTH domain